MQTALERQDAGVDTDNARRLNFVWLEITGQCPLKCAHCYAGSGPTGTHGTMTTSDWLRVIDEAAALGVTMVQFIGGEPTLHPGLPQLIKYALAAELEVEVFTNLVHVPSRLWEIFSLPGVRLATSYYSDDPAQHEAITGGPPSHRRTTDNIARVLEMGIPLRVGVIGGVLDDQRYEQARAHLEQLGVDPDDIGVDLLRQVGRGQRDQPADTSQLCGNCANGVLAVSPDGKVWPCVFSRWMKVGNVHTDSLASIVEGPVLGQARDDLQAVFTERGLGCMPRCSPFCGPHGCAPNMTQPEAACTPRCHPGRGCSPGCHPHCSPSRRN